ncbi:MAG: hypothetical protein ACQEWU_10005 [Bacillota bacterium]
MSVILLDGEHRKYALANSGLDLLIFEVCKGKKQTYCKQICPKAFLKLLDKFYQ